MSVQLIHARYGKQAVRVFRVVREGKWQTVVEYNVTVLLEGDVGDSYTKADNSVIVATDSIKNITYHLAKTSPHILHPERFALHLGTYFVSKYSHIHNAFVTIEQLRWKRIDVRGQEHAHSFWRDGDEKREVNAEVDATKGKDQIVARVSAGISDLLVLKSTGSAFENFIRDEHTTLAEVDDRIFSTSVDLKYTFAPFSVAKNASVDSFKLEDNLSAEGSAWDGNAIIAKARLATLEVFAEDESASVQATLYKMADRILAENKLVQTVTYTLPNKHYIPVDMRYAGIDNLTPCVPLLVFFGLWFLPFHSCSLFTSSPLGFSAADTEQGSRAPVLNMNSQRAQYSPDALPSRYPPSITHQPTLYDSSEAVQFRPVSALSGHCYPFRPLAMIGRLLLFVLLRRTCLRRPDCFVHPPHCMLSCHCAAGVPEPFRRLVVKVCHARFVSVLVSFYSSSCACFDSLHVYGANHIVSRLRT